MVNTESDRLTVRTDYGSLTTIWHDHPDVPGYDEAKRFMGDAK